MGCRGFAFSPNFKEVLFIFSQVFFLLGLFWFLPPASAQRTNTIGTCQTETLGREFITSYMDECGNSNQFEVQITGYFAFTSVSVSIYNYLFGGARFEKKIMVNQGEMVQVRLPESVGIKGTTKFYNVVLVKADKDISVVSVSNKHVSPETTVLYPVSSLGNEHYIVTPSAQSLDSYPEFSVMTYEDRNSVKIHVKDVTFKCQTETLQMKEPLEMCKDVFLQGSNSEFCSFVNSTFVNLETMCAEDRAVSLQEVARPFGSFLSSSTLSAGGKESEGEVASAVTFLLQSVELAALTAALKSPENMTQTVTTESMAIETLLVVPAAGPCDEVYRLRAQNETMDIHCDTVTRAATEDFVAVAFISYSTLDSIINKRFLNEGDLTADEKLRNFHLNSRVVSGAVGNGRPMNLLKPVNFTLRHRQTKKEEEETRCVHWKFIAGKGTWSEDGCTVLHTNSTHTICSCDHLSSFALLMGLSPE